MKLPWPLNNRFDGFEVNLTPEESTKNQFWSQNILHKQNPESLLRKPHEINGIYLRYGRVVQNRILKFHLDILSSRPYNRLTQIVLNPGMNVFSLNEPLAWISRYYQHPVYPSDLSDFEFGTRTLVSDFRSRTPFVWTCCSNRDRRREGAHWSL